MKYKLQINEEGTLSYGHKMPKEVITSAEKQRSIIELEHVDHTTGRIIYAFFYHFKLVTLAHLSFF